MRNSKLFLVPFAGAIVVLTSSSAQAQGRYTNSDSQASNSTYSAGGNSLTGVSPTSSATFKRDVLNASKPVLVDFYASWCGPCKKQAPVVESLSKSFSKKMTFYKVDVDRNPDLAQQYGVSSIPSIKIFKNGSLVDSSVGFLSESELRTRVEQAL